MTRPAVRAATPGDWPRVRALLAAADLPLADLDAAAMKDFLVAVDAAALCGAIGLERYGSAALLRSLVVADSARGRGIGRRLVAALEERALALGVQELWLLTIDAGEFFARHGYRLRPRTDAPGAIRDSREFSALCPADAALYARALQSD